MRILFISRAYPPVVGGIENQNYDLSVWLGKIAHVKIVANKKGRKFLPLFAPYALFYALSNLKKFDAILIGDGVLSFIPWCVKIFSRKPVVAVIHGLDVNYDSSSLGVWYEKFLIFLYQKLWVKLFLPSIDRFIAVGNETARVLQAKNIPAEKIVFIPNGIDGSKYLSDFSRADLENFLGQDLQDKKVIMTSGRLARRKGAAWFIRNVMPKLPENVLYIVAGDGPDKENIELTIRETGLQERVKTIGYMGNPVRDMLFHTCDIFVQPNIKIQGDMEGFGISVIEAAYCGIPVIASDLEGLKDAIQDRQNGFLIRSEDTQGYVSKIGQLLSDETYRKDFGQKAHQYVANHLSWEKISKRYLEEIEKTVNQK
jgi:phosphatidylinositol alpha-1,6-mannosyltransferase